MRISLKYVKDSDSTIYHSLVGSMKVKLRALPMLLMVQRLVELQAVFGGIGC